MCTLVLFGVGRTYICPSLYFQLKLTNLKNNIVSHINKIDIYIFIYLEIN